MPSEADVFSGVSQGTVIGRHLCSAFINDLQESTLSHTRLFADDALIYRHIMSDEDARWLQQVSDALQDWKANGK